MNAYSLHIARTYVRNVLLAAQANRSIRSEVLKWMEEDRTR